MDKKSIHFCAIMATVAIIAIVEPMFGIVAFVLGLVLAPWSSL